MIDYDNHGWWDFWECVHPLTDEDIAKLTSTKFDEFLWSAKVYFEDDTCIPMEEYIEKWMTPEQQEIMHSYIRRELAKLESEFLG